ncbi:bifunctional ornithine acetyltransferase/N-acetylglutamate synthase [Cryptosporangium aurantiacum]|uniref:Arginine biosynthesis bifunctional protein ArgJ n=1 Tax=Cryptosporangium aurantiacum TaxID=134849 RepID=A0A1M7RFS7_9ACTN|nr:bifunctional ornithine acetyltransferase/N-acetylglutamate synthase [Cryptosporangium aurantiacum]SHN44898.1 glutamate N-acetyltransferase / amino-acid N-acetyltransferase [Cryptosporangium aurantiacum]
MSVTSAKGFQASGVAAGLKSNGDPDLALVVNIGPLDAAAGVFTTNRVKAAPVLWSEQVLKAGRLTAVVLNSGGANACTGPAGFQDTHATAERVAERLGCGAADVAVCSTGVIGVRLPIDALLSGVDAAAAALGTAATADGGGAATADATTATAGATGNGANTTADADAYGNGNAYGNADGNGNAYGNADGNGNGNGNGKNTTPGGTAAARAIMTTDTHPKTTTIHGNGFVVGGMAKGAGMLAPALATMLCVLTTDAIADADTLDAALRAATARTFDRIDSDGCMSTNDTVLLLASGASGVRPSAEELEAAVTQACQDLSRQLIGDAEGASKEIAITITGAATEAEAVTVARAIARNNLLMCALFGNDAYWGRVLAAVGTTDATFDPDQLDVSFNGVQVCKNGAADPDAPTVDISGRDLAVGVDLHAGTAEATVYTNDLTLAYVHENSAYTS